MTDLVLADEPDPIDELRRQADDLGEDVQSVLTEADVDDELASILRDLLVDISRLTVDGADDEGEEVLM